jgi:hypothetical protein
MISFFKKPEPIKKVDFFIIGAQKCGTTSLHHYLSLHPALCGSQSKELDYFSYDALFEKGEEWYLSNFKNYRKDQLLFESSPDYCYLPNIPERIYRYNPNAKFIFLVRNPVDRAISAYTMCHKLNSGDLWSSKYLQKLKDHSLPYRKLMFDLLTKKPFPSLKSFIEIEIEHFSKYGWDTFFYEPGFIHRGIYSKQLENYFNVFKKENILVIDFLDLDIKTIQVLNDIENFLGIEKHNWGNITFEKKLEGNYDKSQRSKDEIDLMNIFFNSHNLKFEKMLNRNFNWNRI